MKKQRGANRNIKIFIVILSAVILIFLASYFNALREIKENCQAPAPRFNDLISTFGIHLNNSASLTNFNAQSCVDWLANNKGIYAADCYIKEVEVQNNDNPVITCHCWHRK